MGYAANGGAVLEPEGMTGFEETHYQWDLEDPITAFFGYNTGSSLGRKHYYPSGRRQIATPYVPVQQYAQFATSQEIPTECAPPPGAVWEYIPASNVDVRPQADGSYRLEFQARGRTRTITTMSKPRPMPHGGESCYRFWYKP
jgi:hypothetical protein